MQSKQCRFCQNADTSRKCGERIRCKRFSQWREPISSCDDFVWVMPDVAAVLRELPAADAAPVVYGCVLDNGNPICGPCSACGESVNRKWGYCPSCGARMDKEASNAVALERL